MLKRLLITAALVSLPLATAQATEILNGKLLFESNCITCHAKDGSVSNYGKKLEPWPARNLRAIAEHVPSSEIRRIVTHGTHKTAMKAMKYRYSALEIEAIVDYIKTFTYKPNLANGKKRFKEVCAACHGNDGRANTGVGAKNLVYSKLSLGEKIHTIRYGRPGTLMKSKRHKLSNVDIANIANYVESLKRAGNTKTGGKLFTQNCQSCHASPADIRITGNAAVKHKEISDLDDQLLDLRIRHGRHVDREGRKAIKKLSADNIQDIIAYLRQKTK
ncbi:MAG: c-type cytochrome [Mariprofundaceae bacterium]